MKAYKYLLLILLLSGCAIRPFKLSKTEIAVGRTLPDYNPGQLKIDYYADFDRLGDKLSLDIIQYHGYSY